MVKTRNETDRTKGRLPGRLEGVRKRKRARCDYECEAVLEKLRLVNVTEERGDT